LADGFAVDAFVREWTRLILEPGIDRPADLHAGCVKHHLTDIRGGAIYRGSADQSNTSIRIGDRALLKVIRKLEAGTHPELEMGRFLTERARFSAVPALLGWVNLEDTTLSIIQTFEANEGDGWKWVSNALSAGSAKDRDGLLRWIERLGERTAGLHAALATVTGDPEFDPEPVSSADLERWGADIEAMVQRVIETATRMRAALDEPSTALADVFVQRRREVKSRVAALLRSAKGAAKTRHHGDYHLGQTLVCADDVMIVDFEGEPLRSLSERRAKHSPLRDVAGMLRSIAYVAASADDLAKKSADASGPEARSRLPSWVEQASAIYLQSYLRFAKGSAGCPADSKSAMQLVKLFTLEKALYEVLYELCNRPNWVAIPLAGVLRLLDDPISHDEPGGTRLSSRQQIDHGPVLRADGKVSFRLWAPGCEQVKVQIVDFPDPLPMRTAGMGWHELTTSDAQAGSRYQFILPDGRRVPDPASRFQPADVHGPSEVVNPRSFNWRDHDWGGRSWDEAVLYELHVGTFTSEGTFQAVIERLEHIATLGVTAIEIMPIADFPGGRNWGYDGVFWYAPNSSYGRPEDFKALVDAAHARGLMVLLDVVYNHFGPDGNYLPLYAPAFFTERHQTPWGAAINYDGDHSGPVREFAIENALYWIEEFHLDGLRLDAVHTIIDDSPRHLLEELAKRVHVRVQGRNVHLLLENEDNLARYLGRGEGRKPSLYTAQWNDDVHHVLHTAATGEDQGYYVEYCGDTNKLGRALAEGFAFQGEMMSYRGSRRGEPSSSLPPGAFVSFIQNHDQIGNRAFGERITAIATPEAVRAITAIYILLPQVPMLFMGEEWAAAQPFPFFCDFGPDLADAVRNGRRQEFARFPEFQNEAMRERIPDPQAESTFASAKLNWQDLARDPHRHWLAWYKRLLAVRMETIVPMVRQIGARAARYEVIGPGAVRVAWRLGAGGVLTLIANLSRRSIKTGGFPPGEAFWCEGSFEADGTGGPWSVRWSLDQPGTPE
jgi:malto-oligosyltrehalose trehalohydrolase